MTLASIDTFASSLRAISATPLFADGGTFSLQADERLRIVWIPSRMTLEAIDAIVTISADYPDAEVLLEATTEGPQWPALYVSHLAAEEVPVVEQRLLDPELADADIEGYAVPFILGTTGPDGVTYTEGSFGGVVE